MCNACCCSPSAYCCSALSPCDTTTHLFLPLSVCLFVSWLHLSHIFFLHLIGALVSLYHTSRPVSVPLYFLSLLCLPCFIDCRLKSPRLKNRRASACPFFFCLLHIESKRQQQCGKGTKYHPFISLPTAEITQTKGLVYGEREIREGREMRERDVKRTKAYSSTTRRQRQSNRKSQFYLTMSLSSSFFI